jgi:hypothetical protein
MFVLLVAAVDDQEVISGASTSDPENAGPTTVQSFTLGWTQYSYQDTIHMRFSRQLVTVSKDKRWCRIL